MNAFLVNTQALTKKVEVILEQLEFFLFKKFFVFIFSGKMLNDIVLASEKCFRCIKIS